MASSKPFNPIFISHEQLTKVAGEACFQEALEASKSLVVDHFHSNSIGASGLIDGFEVSIKFVSDRVEGACNCPQSEGFDFCVHCVCLTLQSNKLARQILSLSKGPDKSRVLAYLLSQDKDTLARQCLSLIEDDTEQFERFLLKASLTSDNINYAQLKTQLTELTKKQENLFSQRQVKHFFSKIDRFLTELSFVDLDHQPDKLIKIVEHAVHRINRLLNLIDDSSEQRHACITTLRALYSSVFSRCDGKTDTQAKRFYTLWILDQFDVLGSPDNSLLPEDVLQNFITLSQQAWKKNSNTEQKTLTSWQLIKLARFLLTQAELNKENHDIQKFREAIKQL